MLVRPSTVRARHGDGLHRRPWPLGRGGNIYSRGAAVPIADFDHRHPHAVDQPRLHRVAGAIGCRADRYRRGSAGDPVGTIPVLRLLIEPTDGNACHEDLRRWWRRGIRHVELIVRPAVQVAERRIRLDRCAVGDVARRSGCRGERDQVECRRIEAGDPHRHGMGGWCRTSSQIVRHLDVEHCETAELIESAAHRPEPMAAWCCQTTSDIGGIGDAAMPAIGDRSVQRGEAVAVLHDQCVVSEARWSPQRRCVGTRPGDEHILHGPHVAAVGEGDDTRRVEPGEIGKLVADEAIERWGIGARGALRSDHHVGERDSR